MSSAVKCPVLNDVLSSHADTIQAPANLYVGKIVTIVVPGDDQRVRFKIQVLKVSVGS